MIADAFDHLVAAGGAFRADVIAVNADGSVLVSAPIPGDAHVLCDRLYTGPEPLHLVAGDEVLCMVPNAHDARGVVLGRIGSSRAEPQPASTSEAEAPASVNPEVLVLEATRELTLRVGDGSITIRADGKILIKGTDLVSHAKRMNRIKGGAVSIN
jgi:hypothetical protein